ncbi:ORF MSV247 hypothetical protein [Melanoplus sanguinipes entomopoxvirus]|uniref:Uncharacterized protein n=1 Tax=Melanoplus sanguinipes entomopoxvirus TaxID=83191 RepID=Q9YVJ6_MSEPV|nr:ORF MSV247 hypothetical protein [Melanoplus sanguinipes entomopoxvirus]AAC97739.1 ORF MSV247 hypothetical protein [Melanoplus sanguinipes entomopoxvirus 'O']
MLFCYNFTYTTENRIISSISLLIHFYNFIYFIMLIIYKEKEYEYIYELPDNTLILFLIATVFTIVHNFIHILYTNMIAIYSIILLQFISILIYITIFVCIFILMCINFDTICAIIYLLLCASICSMELAIFVIRWNNYHNNEK